MFDFPLTLSGPGLFVTGTDTGVGKTVATCALARLLRQHGKQVGVCKPLASGCRREGAQWINDDAVALRAAAGNVWPLAQVNPIAYGPPVAPAVAAAEEGSVPDWSRLADVLRAFDRDADCTLVEGVGGLLVPIDPRDAQCTVIDLIAAIGLPTVIVTRAGLGTLNHTAMTCRLLVAHDCAIAGLIVNRHGIDADDASVATNCDWLKRMTGAPVLATLNENAELTGDVDQLLQLLD